MLTVLICIPSLNTCKLFLSVVQRLLSIHLLSSLECQCTRSRPTFQGPFQAGQGQQMGFQVSSLKKAGQLGVLFMFSILFPISSPSFYLEPRWGSQRSISHEPP